MNGLTIFNSLHELPLDHQFLILSAWRASKNAVIRILPAQYPLGAAVETNNGEILTGHKYECFEEPASSHEALEGIAASLDLSKTRVIRAAFVGKTERLRLSGMCCDLLKRASAENSDVRLYFSDDSLNSIYCVSLKDFYPSA